MTWHFFRKLTKNVPRVVSDSNPINNLSPKEYTQVHVLKKAK